MTRQNSLFLKSVISGTFTKKNCIHGLDCKLLGDYREDKKNPGKVPFICPPKVIKVRSRKNPEIKLISITNMSLGPKISNKMLQFFVQLNITIILESMKKETKFYIYYAILFSQKTILP